jgi:hypothetical protein
MDKALYSEPCQIFHHWIIVFESVKVALGMVGSQCLFEPFFFPQIKLFFKQSVFAYIIFSLTVFYIEDHVDKRTKISIRIIKSEPND